MSDVYVTGAAMIQMGKYPESSYNGLALPAVIGAFRSAGISPDEIDTVVCGHAFGGMLTGQRIVKDAGIGGVPVINVDNACSGGATAINMAYSMIKTGQAETALVIGVDKLTQFGGGTLPLVEEDIEVQQGMVMPALYAMRARRYLHERDATKEDLAAVAVKARYHGSLNPFAQFRSETTVEKVLESRSICDPITLFQCCPTGDGAGALILMSEEKMRQLGRPSMRIAASVLHSGELEVGHRDMLSPKITEHCAHDAYEQAGISPSDLDMVELHDAFTIAELVYYEALQLCPKGEATALLRSGKTKLGGGMVVNPSGGLLAKGHPVGASGVVQVVEAFWQLTGQAGKRQIEKPQFAMTHVTGGGLSGLDHGACTVHIFEKN
jgi:acetyl-CoA acetyltransferase